MVAEMIVNQQEFSRPFMAPPGTQPKQMKILRTAFMQAMKKSEARSRRREDADRVNAKSGEEITQIVQKLYATPAPLVERAKKVPRP
jgi:tripartite-type tricarboxylate transporter receptor subunit TctC